MSEIQRDASGFSDIDGAPASEADRDAKIEQLLLVGLDHYFSARYEQAINVWTRALFLDRNHARARAYIERARSALAERQRQSEELLHNGVAAFHRGEGDEARRLLQAAIDGGAPQDEALAVLGRLDRLEVPLASSESGVDPNVAARRDGLQGSGRDRKAGSSRAGATWIVVALIAFALLAWVGYAASASGVTIRSLLLLAEPAAPGAGAPVTDLSLPLPRRGEIALDRARTLASGGRLHEALAALDDVRATDAQRSEAYRLRGDIQRQLLALTTMPATPAPSAPPDRRVP